MNRYTAPGLDADDAEVVVTQLQRRLTSLLDLQLTLKHIHWNVVGPTFIGVHEMLDPQVVEVRQFTDELAERIATLGGVPNGLPGNIVETREWDDYGLGRDKVDRHLGALDLVYSGVIGDHRSALREVEDLDTVSHDLLVTQTSRLELFQWFVRAHLESADGRLSTEGTTTEQGAADAAAASA